MKLMTTDISYICDKVYNHRIVLYGNYDFIRIAFSFSKNNHKIILMSIRDKVGDLLGKLDIHIPEEFTKFPYTPLGYTYKYPVYEIPTLEDFYNLYGNEDNFIFIILSAENLLKIYNMSKQYPDRFNNSELHFLPLTLQIPLPYTLPSIEGKEQLIPKKIHYGWFGGDKKPPLVEYCIQSWYKHHPGWEIIEWDPNKLEKLLPNLDRFKQNKIRGYIEKRYWALINDFVRYNIIYEYGGIYLDADVETIKPLDRFLYTPYYFGLWGHYIVGDGLGFGSVPHHPFFEKLSHDNPTDAYTRINSLKKSKFNELEILDDGSIIYPTDVFSPYQEIGVDMFTENTYSVHNNSQTWLGAVKYTKDDIKIMLGRIINSRSILRSILPDRFFRIPDEKLGIGL